VGDRELALIEQAERGVLNRRAALLRSGRERRLLRGRVAVLMRCRYAACHAVLTLKRRGTVLGNGHAVLGAGDRALVPIRLNAAGRSRVAHHRVSAMVLTIAMANAVTATTPITVRAPRGAR